MTNIVMEQQRIFLVVVAVFSVAWKSGLGNTSTACGGHVNRTWTGNSSCLHLQESNCNVILKCRLESITHLRQLVSHPESIYSLDISNNGLTKLEDKPFFSYKRLVKLNLSCNNINHIQRNAFDGLTYLSSLDLSFNSLLTRNTLNITSQLPSLTELNVIGNPSWLPGQHIRDLPNITAIKGIASYTVPYLDYCIHCNLHKQDDASQAQYLVPSVTHVCFKMLFYFNVNFTTNWRPQFVVKCQGSEPDSQVCKQTRHLQGNESPHYSVELVDLCFDKLNNWVIHNIPIGLAAMVINAVVIATIILSPRLKRNIDMLFIAQLSIGDFSLGLFLVMVTLSYRFLSSSQYHELKASFFCETLSVIIQIAWCLGIPAGFLVTVDRYLCVEYSMKPNVRISLKLAKELIVSVWVSVITISFLPLALKAKPFFFDYSCVSFRFSNGEYYSSYIGYVGVFFYLASYILYARIYYIVRQASLNVGIQREGKLAKRIMFVVSSNVIFLLVPSVAAQFLRINNTEGWVVKIIYWNAVVLSCFGINSCLNPLLYPFRCQRFTSELKPFFKCRKIAVGFSKTHEN